MAGVAGMCLRAASLGRAACYTGHCRLPVPFKSVQAAPRGSNRQSRLRFLAMMAASTASEMTGDNHGHSNGRGEGHQKVVAILPPGGDAAKEPRYVNCVENKLGLPDFLKGKADVVVTADKEGPDSELEQHLTEATIVITTPFHPAYMTRERIEKAKNLKLILTAGIGSDHIDLHAAADHGLTVAECVGSNEVSVAEDEVMRILLLVRNFLPAHEEIAQGEWDVAKAAVKSFDLQGKTVGSLGGGAIATQVMKRLKGFDCELLYYGRHEKEPMKEMGIPLVTDLDEFASRCDVITVNVPLTDKTRGMVNKDVISKMKKGSWIVNNARGAIVNVDDIKEACESGQLGGYSGDVWDKQPAPKDHPWRNMKHQAMTPHTSGTTLDAQVRYQKGVQHMLDCWFKGEPFPEDNYIVRDGELASQYS